MQTIRCVLLDRTPPSNGAVPGTWGKEHPTRGMIEVALFGQTIYELPGSVRSWRGTEADPCLYRHHVSHTLTMGLLFRLTVYVSYIFSLGLFFRLRARIYVLTFGLLVR